MWPRVLPRQTRCSAVARALLPGLTARLRVGHPGHPFVSSTSRSSADLLARHLAKVVESSDDAIVSKSLDGTIISWNRAAERIFGYSAAEAVGRSIRMIIPPDRQAEEDAVLAEIRAGRPVEHFETLRQTKSGTLIPIALTVSPVRDDAGVIVGASKIAHDLTREQEGRLAARQLSAIVASTDDAIVAKTLDGTITAWNPAAERMFGYTAAEAIGQSVRMLIPAELQGEEDTVLAKLRAGESIDHYETLRVRKDGSQVSISLTVSPIRDERGAVVGASKIARDVTEQTRLRLLAQGNADHAATLAEVGANVASTLDPDVIVRKVIDAATRLTGATYGVFFRSSRDRAADANVLYTVSGAFPGAARVPPPRSTVLFEPAFTSQTIVRVDDVMQDAEFGRHWPFYGLPAGGPQTRSFLAVPIRGFRGNVLGGLFFGHETPAAFTETHERLAAGVAAWAAVALENARLYVEARDANRMKDEFLAVLSHELRTPLNAIVGYARLLRGGFLEGERARAGLETVERNAGWLTQIVEDVLDVSSIVSGKIRLDVQPVDLFLVIDNAITTVRPAADARGVRIHTVVDPRVGPISGDPDRLQQVIWNLVANAVKFTPKGGRVQVEARRVNSHAEISVSDTGIGIAASFLPFVFERFRQADAGTTRKTGGLGLGLSIVRHLVEMHGGEVMAESGGEGQGATFRITLPLMVVSRKADGPGRQHPRVERRAPLSELASLEGVHVLAVDDEPDALSVLRAALEAAGATVTTLTAPDAVLAAAHVARPDALLLDLGMPGMDGYDVIRQVRAASDPRVSQLPAAALTAFARSEDRTKALRSGFQLHLAKPVDPGELVAAIAALVGRPRLSEP